MEKVWVEINHQDSESTPEPVNQQEKSTRNKMETMRYRIASRQQELESIQDGHSLGPHLGSTIILQCEKEILYM